LLRSIDSPSYERLKERESIVLDVLGYLEPVTLEVGVYTVVVT